MTDRPQHETDAIFAFSIPEYYDLVAQARRERLALEAQQEGHDQ